MPAGTTCCNVPARRCATARRRSRPVAWHPRRGVSARGGNWATTREADQWRLARHRLACGCRAEPTRRALPGWNRRHARRAGLVRGRQHATSPTLPDRNAGRSRPGVRRSTRCWEGATGVPNEGAAVDAGGLRGTAWRATSWNTPSLRRSRLSSTRARRPLHSHGGNSVPVNRPAGAPTTRARHGSPPAQSWAVRPSTAVLFGKFCLFYPFTPCV
jgi:hypothetical protein